MNYIKQKLSNYITKHVLNAFVLEDVITQDAGKIYLGGKEVTEERIKQWQAETKAIEGSDIWVCIQESLKYQAQDKIFNRSTNFEDVMYGKSMLYNLSLIKSFFKVVKSRQVK